MGHYVELGVNCRLVNPTDPVLATIFLMARMDAELVGIVGEKVFHELQEKYAQVSTILKCNNVYDRKSDDNEPLSEPHTKVFKDPKDNHWVIDTVANFKYNGDQAGGFFAMITPFVVEKTNKPIGYTLSVDERQKRYYRINKLSHTLEVIGDDRYHDTKDSRADIYLVKSFGLFEDEPSMLYEGDNLNEAFKIYNEPYESKMQYNALYVCNDYEKLLYVCNQNFKNKRELKAALKPVEFY